MENVIQLVLAYREEIHMELRAELAGKLAEILVIELRPWVLCRVKPSLADDIMQETMKAIFTSLFKFKGKTEKEFWKWCYIITRNKTADRLCWDHKNLLYFPAEELYQFLEASEATASSLSPEDWADLRAALDLIGKVDPTCRQSLVDYYVVGLDYIEIAEQLEKTYDAMRMKIQRCVELAHKLVMS